MSIQNVINQGITTGLFLKDQNDIKKSLAEKEQKQVQQEQSKAEAQAQKEKAKVEAKKAKAEAQAKASLELERAEKRKKHVDFTRTFLEGTGVNAFDYLNKEGKQ